MPNPDNFMVLMMTILKDVTSLDKINKKVLTLVQAIKDAQERYSNCSSK